MHVGSLPQPCGRVRGDRARQGAAQPLRIALRARPPDGGQAPLRSEGPAHGRADEGVLPPALALRATQAHAAGTRAGVRRRTYERGRTSVKSPTPILGVPMAPRLHQPAATSATAGTATPNATAPKRFESGRSTRATNSGSAGAHEPNPQGGTYGGGKGSCAPRIHRNRHRNTHSTRYASACARRIRLLGNSLSSLRSSSCSGVRQHPSRTRFTMVRMEANSLVHRMRYRGKSMCCVSPGCGNSRQQLRFEHQSRIAWTRPAEGVGPHRLPEKE